MSDYESNEDIEWEDVSLDSFKFEIKHSKTKKEVQNEKRKRSIEFKRKWLKTAFAIHLIEIPLFLKKFELQYLTDICNYKNHKLIQKKIIPKLIQKKFKDWNNLRLSDPVLKADKSRTLILGLCMWFRSNFKINGNGDRQNPYRLRNIIYNDFFLNKDTTGKRTIKYKETLSESYYGHRGQNSGDFRTVIKTKKGTRDQMVLVFYIILLNLIDLGEHDELRLIYSLPLCDYKRVEYLKFQSIEAMMNLDHKCPNISDSDLFSPYYWIEYKTGNQIYTIDPVVELNRDHIVERHKIDQYQPHFQDMCSKSGLNIQSHYYVIGINQNFEVMDLSGRYLNNILYRSKPCLVDLHSNKDWKSYCIFRKFIKSMECDFIDTTYKENRNPLHEELQSLKKLSLENIQLPQTLYHLKISPNFISDIFIRKNLEVIKGSPLNTHISSDANTGKNQNQHNSIRIYYRHEMHRIRSEYHWLTLGRSLKSDAHASYSKNSQRLPGNLVKKPKLFLNDEFELTHLYTIDQTYSTPRLPSLASVHDYRNKFGDVKIFNRQQITPIGFNIVPKNCQLHGVELNNLSLLKKFNRKKTKSVEDKIISYIDVVSGFDFKKKPGFAVAIKKDILLSDQDFQTLKVLQKQEIELHYLHSWYWTLKKLKVQKRLDESYEALLG